MSEDKNKTPVNQLEEATARVVNADLTTEDVAKVASIVHELSNKLGKK